MNRIVLTVIILLISNSVMNAGERKTKGETPLLTFGTEWGYVSTIHSGYHYNYFAPDGHRESSYDNSFGYVMNAEFSLHLGVNLNERYNLSVLTGYTGISDIHNAIPLSLRLTRYYNHLSNGDRWFSFVDAGSGISIRKHPEEIFIGKLGGGYRVSLSRDAKLDLLAAFRFVLTHPELKYEGTEVGNIYINRNNAYTTSISVGVGLTF